MRGHPPKRELTEEQKRAAQAFVTGAEENPEPDKQNAETDSAPKRPAEHQGFRQSREADQERSERANASPHSPQQDLPGAQREEEGSWGREHPNTAASYSEEKYPWQQDYVREDVVKGYALRLPEPLYLKLKYVSKRTRISMNELINNAVESIVEDNLRQLR